jgi:DNA invertase Pin-like site-specific DNA recombinase
MKIGYIRISNKDESPIKQIAALAMENCDRVVEEQSPHATKERPELATLLAEMKQGDTLVVWGFERLAYSFSDLNETIAALHARGITLHSLREKFISTHPDAAAMLRMLRHLVDLKTFIDGERGALIAAGQKANRVRFGGNRKLSDRDMQMILALIDNKIPKVQIAKKFGISQQALSRSLRDPRYRSEVILRPRRNKALKERLHTKDAPTSPSNDEG